MIAALKIRLYFFMLCLMFFILSLPTPIETNRTNIKTFLIKSTYWVDFILIKIKKPVTYVGQASVNQKNELSKAIFIFIYHFLRDALAGFFCVKRFCFRKTTQPYQHHF